MPDPHPIKLYENSLERKQKCSHLNVLSMVPGSYSRWKKSFQRKSSDPLRALIKTQWSLYPNLLLFPPFLTQRNGNFSPDMCSQCGASFPASWPANILGVTRLPPFFQLSHIPIAIVLDECSRGMG